MLQKVNPVLEIFYRRCGMRVIEEAVAPEYDFPTDPEKSPNINEDFLVASDMRLSDLFDCLMTEKRIKKHGPGVELNPITRSLARKYGASLGSFLGIML